MHGGPDEGDDLCRLSIDDLRSDGVTLGCLEDERREFAEPGPGNPSAVNLTSELDRRRATEVLRDESLEAGLRAAAVLAAGRRGDGRQTDRAPAVHLVAADLTERGKAHVAPVRTDADAIHSGSAGDRDAPTSRASRPQDGEGVVPDVDVGGPAAWLCRGGISLLLVREVETGQANDREVGRDADLRCERVDHVGARLHADVMRMAERAAGEAEQRSVLPDERRIGLRAAAVDREDGLQRIASATSWSSRPSTSSTWPIRGCASSAFRASTGSRLSAARTVSRS